jgi:hypothetical protein
MTHYCIKPTCGADCCMCNRAISEEQRDILRHALGLGRSAREYRNHFVTGPGSTDYPHCEALVSEGLMTRCEGHKLSGGDPIYSVTEAGKAVARSKQPNVISGATAVSDGVLAHLES